MRKLLALLAVIVAVGVFFGGSAAQADDYTGTNGPDFIDTVDSVNTNDNVNAKAGSDTVLTHNGSDNVFAGRGNDEVRTGKGDDGQHDYDVISGAVNGYFGDDLLVLGPGDDVAVGDEGADTLRGQNGSDTLAGGFGRDILNGGGGDDYLTPGPSADIVRAGANNDTVYVGVDGDGPGAPDEIQCGDGDDTVVYSGAVDTNDELGDCEHVIGTV